MALCSAQVTSRANSDLLQIEFMGDDLSLSTPERMEMIGAVIDQYRAAVGGSVEQIRAEKRCRAKHPLIWSLTDYARKILKGGN